MSMQPFPQNPIEKRKADVRKYAKTGATMVVGGVAGGLVLGLLLHSNFLLVLGFAIAVVGGFVNYRRIQKIANHKDQ